VLAPLVHNLTGVRVKPGFVKVVSYEEGAQLPPHRDQVQNYLSIYPYPYPYPEPYP